MKRLSSRALVAGAILFAGLSEFALAAQDKYTVKVPDGLAFSEFRGYEDWRPVAVSQTDTGLKVISANTEMINAYKSGLPAKGKKFPEGSKIVKIEWTLRKSPVSPYAVNEPDTLKSVSFIEKDSKRFPKTDGWAYAQFAYDAKTATFKPNGTGTDCGHACHTAVAAQDFIFTAYPRR